MQHCSHNRTVRCLVEVLLRSAVVEWGSAGGIYRQQREIVTG